MNQEGLTLREVISLALILSLLISLFLSSYSLRTRASTIYSYDDTNTFPKYFTTQKAKRCRSLLDTQVNNHRFSTP